MKDNDLKLNNLLSQCIHCGLCLPACPTYLATGRETESPRGRIYLLTTWAAGQENIQSETAKHIESCLGCLGCQTACPSGVDYRRILNNTMPYLAKNRPFHVRMFMRFCFSNVLPNYKSLRFLGKLISFWQKIGGIELLRKATLYCERSLPLLACFFRELTNLNSFVPPIPTLRPVKNQSQGAGDGIGEIELFSGCVMDVLYNHVNHACQRLLSNANYTVHVPPQTCCGALAFHHGESDIAAVLAKRNIEYFEQTNGPIIVTSSGCAAMLKEYADVVGTSNDWKDRASRFASRVQDSSEFFAQNKLKLKLQTKGNYKVAYHAACHLEHAQKTSYTPKSLLEEIVGADEKGILTLVPLKEYGHCCGSAGIYNLTNTDLSLDVLTRKIDLIEQTGADVIVTTNPGCLLQLERGIKERGLNIKVLHLLEFLDHIRVTEGDE